MLTNMFHCAANKNTLTPFPSRLSGRRARQWGEEGE